MGTPLFTGDVFQWARFCNEFLMRLPTRQDGVENHDKVYSTVNIWVGLGFNSKEGRDGGLAGKKIL